jgi:hypothetical protein
MPDIIAHVTPLQQDRIEMRSKKEKRQEQSLWQFPKAFFYGKEVISK